jgi:hypothetical protein
MTRTTFPRCCSPIERNEADVVFGDRFAMRNHVPLIRRLFNALGNVVTLLATGRWVQ